MLDHMNSRECKNERMKHYGKHSTVSTIRKSGYLGDLRRPSLGYKAPWRSYRNTTRGRKTPVQKSRHILTDRWKQSDTIVDRTQRSSSLVSTGRVQKAPFGDKQRTNRGETDSGLGLSRGNDGSISARTDGRMQHVGSTRSRFGRTRFGGVFSREKEDRCRCGLSKIKPDQARLRTSSKVKVNVFGRSSIYLTQPHSEIIPRSSVVYKTNTLGPSYCS